MFRTCLRTLAALLLALAPHAAPAASSAPLGEHLLGLATCYGRYTAVRENAWLMGGEEDALRFRLKFIGAMMDSLSLTAGERAPVTRSLLTQRIRMKNEFRNLLSTAQFGSDPRRKSMATAMIKRQLAACDSFLLAPRFSGF